jgi:anti-sigma regulatory factor (Ser/Thr protein kinase)
MLSKKGSVSTTDVAHRLSVSRQAAHRRLQRLAAAGHVVHQGAGRAARWAASGGDRVFRFRIAGLEEDRVWTEAERTIPLLTVLRDDARSIVRYAFTELLNNAIEHSRSKTVEVRLGGRERVVWFEVIDFGVGAFENVRRQRKLRTTLDAPAELSKGKVTTDPEHHTGEGIFFTSKAVWRFELESNGVLWVVDAERNDQTLQASTRRRGTRVRCEIAKKPRRRLQQVFDEYTIDLEFARTKTVVRLFARGVEFVSRSEARRLLQGLDKFREVVLDFERVRSIGQGFADEIFRVWAAAHRDIELIPVNTVPEVQFMIERARRSTAPIRS